ncbi:MAG: RlmE family RNA methyltransferase [Spirochaetaceae bacterium]|jgi:23S rRNA (uridine2552-2'-O)-methyltransferase|nr:RlmE family RNA methyltransferase [Spirochaetaceae bacterium]
MTTYEKPDFWALKAQREGYPARSVYKLQEMDEKFKLFRPGPPGFRGLDLGAAPGSWSLYALRRMEGRLFLAAADLAPLPEHRLFRGDHFFFIRGDMTTENVREALLARGPYDLVMSDAAPATTGNRAVDTLRSLALAETALFYAETALVKGGNLVVKVFQGGDSAGLLDRMRELFVTGKSFKPRSCRSSSFETYYIGLEKR